MTFKKIKVFVCNIFIMLCLCSCVLAKSLSWLQGYRVGYFYVGDPVEFNCSLDDASVNVSLWFKDVYSEYKKRIPDSRLKQNGQVFKIDPIKSYDSGFYQCRAENSSHLIWKLHATYDGIPRPKPKISTNPRKVTYGKKMVLTCTATGHVLLKWFKKNVDGKLIKLQAPEAEVKKNKISGKLETKRTYTIKNFGKSEQGSYKCVLERRSVNYYVFVYKNLTLDAFKKPHFSKFPPFNQYVDQGRDTFVEYEVAGVPEPTITWYRVNFDHTEDLLAHYNTTSWNNVNKTYYEADHYYFDILKPLFPKDNAIFKCVAENMLGSMNKTFHLTVKAPPEIAKKNDELDSVEIDLGSPETKVVCVVEKANPRKITYTWEKQAYRECGASSCKPKDTIWKTLVANSTKNFNIESNSYNSTLTLKQNENRIYVRCTAENSVGKTRHTWTLSVLANSKLLVTSRKLVIADEGTDVSLSCKADELVRKVFWRRNNTIIQTNSRFAMRNSTSDHKTRYTLVIRRANITDQGTYQCVGDIGANGTVYEKISLTVQEVKAPSVYLGEDFVRQQSSWFKILCNVTGHPKPNIMWSQDGQTLLPDSLPSRKTCSSTVSGIYRFSSEEDDHNAVLVVCGANYKNHSGLFTCMASNKLGNASDSVRINITAPPAIGKLERTYYVELGVRFSLLCVSDGNPQPRVWWEKQNKDGSKEFKPLGIQGNNLTFVEVNENTFGSYQCVAENEIDRKTKKIKIERVTVSAKRVDQSHTDNSKKYAVVIGCVSAAILAIVIIVAVILYKRKKIYGGFYILTLPPMTDYIKKLDPGTPLSSQTNKLPYDPEWEFPRNRLKFYRELGSGAFGKVFLAEGIGIVAFDPRGSTKRRSSRRRFGGSARRNHYVNNNKMTKVAVKTLKEDSGETEFRDLLSELKILIHVGEHKNIVNLLGACTKGRESELWVIIEYCSNGNLLQFLRNRRDIYETEWKGVSKDPNSQLTMTDLVIAAYQIARGMEFLASRMCIHRDLATRNILVTENYVIKIADFGLARDVGKDSQYVKTSTGLLPVKWMAIEAIVERLFTEKSDVWSFGIVLWELFTLGGTPYPNISPNEVSEFLVRGHRMDPPHACPEEIASLMTTCWQDDRDSRPTFKEMVEVLDKIIEIHTSSEGGCGYLQVQGDEVMNDYLIPSEVKSPQMDPFECNSPLPPIPSPGVDERDSLIERDQNARKKMFHFDKSANNRAARQDSELEKVKNDRKPETAKSPDTGSLGNDIDGYIDTSLTGKEKERIERELEKDRDSSEEHHPLDKYAYWKKSAIV